jgi:hypothetical protein
MNELSRILSTDGICYFDDIYSSDEVNSINTAIDPLLASRGHERRAYVHVDEMGDLGLLNTVLSPRMKALLFSMMSDPVLYHCHIYEIAANATRSHIFDETLSGWHRDPDSEYHPNEATHVSVFVYLTDVGEDDGTFQFIPQNPLHWLWKSTPRVSVTGKAGFSFAWNRAYFHRAAPNRGPRRRRLLKLSIQPNKFTSIHLTNEHFQRVLASTSSGDLEMDVLLGRFQGGVAPRTPGSYQEPNNRLFDHTGELGVANASLAKFQMRNEARKLKKKLKSLLSKPPVEAVPYD